MRLMVRISFLLFLTCSGAAAQVPGPPENPAFFTVMSGVSQATLDAPLPAPKGLVQRLKWEEFQRLPGKSEKNLSPKRVITIQYDGQQHEIERRDENLFRDATSKTAKVWNDGRLQSQESISRNVVGPGNRVQRLSVWNRFVYDSAGRVSDYRSGGATGLETHCVNYLYDSKNRVLSWDDRRGAEDIPFGHTAIKYSGNLVETTMSDVSGQTGVLEVQMLDDAARVVDLRFSEFSGEQVKLWYHTTFKYDNLGRVIEQSTDPFHLDENNETFPMPGKFVTEYDDAKHFVYEKLYRSDGSLGFHATGQFDKDGLLIAFRSFDSAGKEGTPGEFGLDPKTGEVVIQKGIVAWEVTYDDQGNWTERKRWLTPADGGPRILNGRVLQTITYQPKGKQ
jgi:hypothetical protein